MVEDFSKAAAAVAKLLGALAWPAVFLYVVVRFRAGIGEFLANLGEVSLKGGGVDVSLKAKAGALLAAASVARSTEDATDITPDKVKNDAQESVDVVDKSVNRRVVRQAANANILWVDDHPDHNTFERRSLETFGVSFALARSTDEALQQLRSRSFDVVISDMGRPPDFHAGITLINEMTSLGIRIPTIIYASRRALAGAPQEELKKAFGFTTRANELFSMVLAALGNR